MHVAIRLPFIILWKGNKFYSNIIVVRLFATVTDYLWLLWHKIVHQWNREIQKT